MNTQFKILLLAYLLIPTITFGQNILGAKPDSDTSAIQAAQFPGGKDSLTKFLNKNFTYQHKGLCSYPGSIYVEFTVEENGDITNIKYVKPTEVDVYRETMRVLKLMPKWEPARENGKVIKTIVRLPIYLRS
jgi:hypothetical protein